MIGRERQLDVEESRHLATPPDTEGGSSYLAMLSPLSVTALSPSSVLPPIRAAAAHKGRSGGAEQDDGPSTTAAVPLLPVSLTADEATESTERRRSSVSVFATTPPFFRSGAVPWSASAGVAASAAPLSSTRASAGTMEEGEELRVISPTSGLPPSTVTIITTSASASISGPGPAVSNGDLGSTMSRPRRKLRGSEVSFATATATAAATAARPSTTSGANYSASSGGGQLRIPGARFGKGTGGGGSPLPADSVRAGPSYRTGSSMNDDSRLDSTAPATAVGVIGGEASSSSAPRSTRYASGSWSPHYSSSGVTQPLIRLAPNTRSSVPFPSHHRFAAGVSATDATAISTAGRQPGLQSSRVSDGACRIPLSVAVLVGTVLTVILVAALTIVPLNAVSVQAADYATATLSLSLASSYTRSVEASMLFLPNAISAYAFAYMGSAVVQAWDWTAKDMPQAMRQMCHTVAGTHLNPTSLLLYMSLSSPYSGYSAYCSPQDNSSYLVGNYITDNSSKPRYVVNGSTYDYAMPLEEYPAVLSMTPSDYTVEFGGSGNTWNTVVLPWYRNYMALQNPERRFDRGAVSGSASFASYGGSGSSSSSSSRRSTGGHVSTAASVKNSLQYLDGYWSVFTHNNVSVITYTFPFVDYLGNPACITGALQPDGFNALYPRGLIDSHSTARAMVVDAVSGLVFITSWLRDTTVRMDNWNTSCNCTPGGNDPRAVYLEDITDPLMSAAVAYVGGQQGIADTPPEVSRWMGQFTADGTDNLIIVNRVNVSADASYKSLIVMYAVRKNEFTASISNVQRSAIIAVVTVLAVVVLIEVVLLYLLLQPIRGVAAGLRAAAELRDGSECVDHVTSVLKEVAEMQRDFHRMNAKLMQMRTFLPQGMLDAQATGSDTQANSDMALSFFRASGSPPQSGGAGGGGYDMVSGASDVFGDGDHGDHHHHGGPASRGMSGEGGEELGTPLNAEESGRRQQRHRRRDAAVADGAYMQLNDRVLLEEVNHFRRRYCSVITFCMHLMESEISVKFLNEHCTYFMEGVLPCVLRYGGVVELQRPDYIVVGFGAHNKVAMHQNRAAKCALEVMHLLNTTTPIGPRVGCLIDASEYYVGTCGAASRNSLVAFTHSFVPKTDLIRVLKSVQTQILLTQRLASTLESSMLVMPVDCMLLNPLGERDIILYELRGHIRMLPPEVPEVMVRQVIRAVRMGFTRMLKGDYVRALEILEPYEATELQAARLGAMCRAFTARNLHRPFMRSVARLTFSEAHFTGYHEDTPAEWGESHASGTSFGAYGYPGGAGAASELANPLSAGGGGGGGVGVGVGGGGGGGGASLFASPFSNELDPTALLTSPPTMRLVVGAALTPPSPDVEVSKRTTEGSVTAAGAVSALTRADDGSHRAQSSSSRTAGASAADGTLDGHDGETALFEMFVEDCPDDDDDDDADGDGREDVSDRTASGGHSGGQSPSRRANGGGGGGGGGGVCGLGEGCPDHSSAAAGGTGTAAGRRLRKGELPLSFNDYEGSPWRRSYDVLGTGAFSTVYRGLSASGNLVALKCFRLGARNIDVHTIVDEVRLFSNLHHENVVQYLSLYVSESYVIEIMEFVPGGSLDTLLKSFGLLQPESVRRYLRDITRGLHYLHTASIVHCDIKPHNVLLAMDGQCKLSDFGSAIARATSSVCKIDDVLEMRGTPGYMAPEVARGDVPTMKSDVYSLGITILELLTGKLPWDYAEATASGSPERLTRRKSAAERHASLLQLRGLSSTESAAVRAAGNGAEVGSEIAAAHPPLGPPTTALLSSSAVLLSSSSYIDPTAAATVGATKSDFGGGPMCVANGAAAQEAAYTSLTLHGDNGGMNVATTRHQIVGTESEMADDTAAAVGMSTAITGVTTTPAFVSSRAHTAGSAAAVDSRGRDGNTCHQQRHSVVVPSSASSPRTSAALPSTVLYSQRASASAQRRPIDQVLRSATQLVVYIGRGLVVPHIPDTLDEDVIDFLELCLSPDPAERASMSELMLHPWLM
ncbi:protein kinase [Novymonas esmeraldas]|uniref:Protein kinase n=1 Tax=Novymonas esmeraldas TaxID=1808958 RepID=A0AAW0F7X7_9TRYP